MVESPNSSSIDLCRPMSAPLYKRQTHDDSVLARAVPRGIIILATPDGLEAKSLIQANRARIRRPHFQQHAVELLVPRDAHCFAQQREAGAVALRLRCDTQVEQMHFIDDRHQHAVSQQRSRDVAQADAEIAVAQRVLEIAAGPGKVVGELFHGCDLIEIAFRHRRQIAIRKQHPAHRTGSFSCAAAPALSPGGSWALSRAFFASLAARASRRSIVVCATLLRTYSGAA